MAARRASIPRNEPQANFFHRLETRDKAEGPLSRAPLRLFPPFYVQKRPFRAKLPLPPPIFVIIKS